MAKTATSVAAPLPTVRPAQGMVSATWIHLCVHVMRVLVGLTAMRKRVLPTEQACHVQVTENVKREHASVLIVGRQLIVGLQLAQICARVMESAMLLQLASVSLAGRERTVLCDSAQEVALDMENATPKTVFLLAHALMVFRAMHVTINVQMDAPDTESA